jgi:hypothetical protein
MTYVIPMPSPRGTNHERLFVRPFRGPAYDARGGLLGYDAQPPQPSKACQVADRLVSLLSQDELSELGREVIKARDAKMAAAQDEEAAASLDPYKTAAGVNWTLQRKKQLNAGGSAMDEKRRRQITQDAHFGSVMKAAFARPGTATYDARERRKLAADAATTRSLAERFPGFDRIGVQPMETDPHARPHRLAIDSSINARLDALYGPVRHAI